MFAHKKLEIHLWYTPPIYGMHPHLQYAPIYGTHPFMVHMPHLWYTSPIYGTLPPFTAHIPHLWYTSPT